MITKKLKELRLSFGLSQKVLSKKLNISPSRYSNYELGRREPDLNLLMDIAIFFSVSVDFILGLEKEKRISEFSFAEKKLIANFQLLNSLAQGKIINYTDDLIANKNNLAQKEVSKKHA